MDCGGECNANQIKLDRSPSFTHWGRIDPHTGADQRGHVGLLSRNVRFYGEMNPDGKCKYAKTRDQLALRNGEEPPESVRDANWCWYYTDVNGGEMDLHGGHIMATKDFDNFHLSHIEIFNAGQPLFGRYPVHWHLADKVGHCGEGRCYEDPSMIEALSIHDNFSRFVTIHGTHEATIKNCVDYNTFGHGFFLEDGLEVFNHVIGNLGAQVKPGIILPSERSKQACGITSDALHWSNYTDTTLCQGLAVFWFANIHNYVHDNVAVGGNSGYWVFTHTEYDTYQFDAMPKDPISGHREWRGNKACCANAGMSVDDSIMDQYPSDEFPVPRFSIGNEFGMRHRSLDNPRDGIINCDPKLDSCKDDRPHLWKNSEDGQPRWADNIFNQMNIHHTDGLNWARGCGFSVINSQFSDNFRSWINKGTGPCPGSIKAIRNSTFIGFTRNTGHRVCMQPSGNAVHHSYDLITVRACADTREQPVDLMTQRPLQEVLKDRRIFWFKGQDGVFRLHGEGQFRPLQAIALYDTTIPALTENNTFIDYPAADPALAQHHAIGPFFAHPHQVTPKSHGVRNNRYINVDRIWQTPAVSNECPQVNPGGEQCGSGWDPTTSWGDDHGTTPENKIRSLTDGEINNGFTDLDGIFLGEPAYVFNLQQHAVNTNCRIVSGEEIPGILNPGAKLCPITTPTASLALGIDFGSQGEPHATDGRPFYIESLPLVEQSPTVDEMSPMRLYSNRVDMKGHVFNTVEAFKVHKMWYEKDRIPDKFTFILQDADFNTWYRFSLCIGKGRKLVPNEQNQKLVHSSYHNFGDDVIQQGFPYDNDGVQSLSELNAMATDSFWHDEASGWFHVKMVQTEDRSIGGEFEDRLDDLPQPWPRYNCSSHFGWLNDEGEPATWNKLGTRYRASCWKGQHQIWISTGGPFETGVAPVCDDFEVEASVLSPPTNEATTTTVETATTAAPIG